jgi:hypothetical protein
MAWRMQARYATANMPAGIKASRNAGRRSREEEGVNLFDATEASKPDPLKRAAVLVPVNAKPFGWP